MQDQTPKARRLETPKERADRIKEADRRAIDAALAEQDALDAMVRRSIKIHGA